MNILITGANGQLGRTFRDVSGSYGHKYIFTSYTASEDTVALDITDKGAVMEMMTVNDIDVVINCAGYTDVAGAETEVEEAWRLNVEGPLVLACAAKDRNAVLVHFSSDYVFDGEADRPYLEHDEPRPLSVYGKTKLEGDKAVMDSGCGYLIFRTSWLYSCHGKNFFKTILAKASSQPFISVVDDQIGTPTYAIDLADAVLRVIADGKHDRYGIYNYSNEGVSSWHGFASAINDKAGCGCDVRPCRTSDYPSKVSRPAYSVLDKGAFRETFGYDVPQWKDSLDACMNEFQKINK